MGNEQSSLEYKPETPYRKKRPSPIDIKNMNRQIAKRREEMESAFQSELEVGNEEMFIECMKTIEKEIYGSK